MIYFRNQFSVEQWAFKAVFEIHGFCEYTEPISLLILALAREKLCLNGFDGQSSDQNVYKTARRGVEKLVCGKEGFAALPGIFSAK